MAEIFGISVTGGSSGEGATLTVIAPQNTQSITIKKDEKTYTKQGTTAEFKNLEAGTWEITSLSTTGQVSGKKEVTIVLQYSSQTAYFAANIQVTYPAGSTCTCSKGEIVLNAPDTTGSHIFVVPEAGEWIVSSTDGELTDSESVTITSDGESKSITLEYFTATIVTTFPTDCTSVTCTKGDTVLSVPSGSLASGEHTFSVHEAGEWTVTAENDSSSKSETVNVAESKAYTVDIKFTLILYESGSEYPEITGAWEVTSSSGEYADACEITKNAKNMVFFAAYHSTASFSHSQPIDMSGYATLHILGKFDNKSTGERGTAGISTSNSGEEFNASVSMSGIDSGNVQRDVDLSNVNTNAYFKIYMEDTCQFTASKIWLD